MSTPSSAIPNMPAEPASQPRLSEPARLINVFASPAKTFQDIRQNASWWVPLVILSIVSIFFFQMIDKKVGFDEVARHMMESNSRVQQLPADQQARTIEVTAKFLKGSGYVSPIFALLYAAVIAGVLWFSFNFFMDAQIPFSRAMAIVFYGWLPTIVGTALATITLTLGNPEGFRLENPVGTNRDRLCVECQKEDFACGGNHTCGRMVFPLQAWQCHFGGAPKLALKPDKSAI